ncbi:MAG: hypothetical protein PHS32_16405 [Rhodoferax sp.]|uniref:hypothetical protein n=1 Tax=Rhodoferax sp. TaxID=50421 RepID=UPI00262A8E85|nr:hypothetical protein [Rhodoferax sp.]MDD5335315.1 hypothetical protein [Rhodoferax sp.]
MKNLVSPHVLLIGNPYTTINNLKGILDDIALENIKKAVILEIQLLFQLGMDHYSFAKNIDQKYWRQKVSRLYYAAYNIRRAIQLQDSGKYSTDVSDHKDIDNLPPSLNQRTIHGSMLRQLRDDRNLADYSHLGQEGDLFATTKELEQKVDEFLIDCRNYLKKAGIIL